MLDNIEYHHDNLPEGCSSSDAAPLIALIPGWAYERGLLSEEVARCDVFKERYKASKEGEQDIMTFVDAALDGGIVGNMFKKKTKKFVKEYISLGVYYTDIQKFFATMNIYSIPEKWEGLENFYLVLDARFEEFKSSGEFPVYNSMKV